jgi:hypothetical protein
MNPRWLVVVIGAPFDRAASVHTIYCRSEETAKALTEWANTLWKVEARYFDDLSAAACSRPWMISVRRHRKIANESV